MINKIIKVNRYLKVFILHLKNNRIKLLFHPKADY